MGQGHYSERACKRSQRIEGLGTHIDCRCRDGACVAGARFRGTGDKDGQGPIVIHTAAPAMVVVMHIINQQSPISTPPIVMYDFRRVPQMGKASVSNP
jgi:hypothetical protein